MVADSFPQQALNKYRLQVITWLAFAYFNNFFLDKSTIYIYRVCVCVCMTQFLYLYPSLYKNSICTLDLSTSLI